MSINNKACYCHLNMQTHPSLFLERVGDAHSIGVALTAGDVTFTCGAPHRHSSIAAWVHTNMIGPVWQPHLIPQQGGSRTASPEGTSAPACIRPKLRHPQTHSRQQQSWRTSSAKLWVTTGLLVLRDSKPVSLV